MTAPTLTPPGTYVCDQCGARITTHIAARYVVCMRTTRHTPPRNRRMKLQPLPRR